MVADVTRFAMARRHQKGSEINRVAALENLSWRELVEQLRALPAKAGAPAAEASQLVHELHVHQVELEMQNRELREVHERLEESQDHYRELYDRAPVGYVTLDAHGIITQSNVTAAALLQRERDQLVRAALGALLRDGIAFQSHLREAAKARAPATTEAELKTAEGFVPVELTTTPHVSGAGEIVGFRTAMKDITERRRADVERAALESERRTRAEAEAENRMKDQFLGMVSHELRTPLGALLGWTRLMTLRQGDAEFVARGLQVMQRNGEMLAKIVDDILDVSRIVSGKLRIDTKPTSVNEAVLAALDLAKASAAAKQITLETSLQPDCVVLGDALRLQQVGSNLLSNAIKFGNKGGRVEVALARDGASVSLVVRDDGCGIELSELPHVFDYFGKPTARAPARTWGSAWGWPSPATSSRHTAAPSPRAAEAATGGRNSRSSFRVSRRGSRRRARTAGPRRRRPPSPA